MNGCGIGGSTACGAAERLRSVSGQETTLAFLFFDDRFTTSGSHKATQNRDEDWALTGLEEKVVKDFVTQGFSQKDPTRLAVNAITQSTAALGAEMSNSTPRAERS